MLFLETLSFLWGRREEEEFLGYPNKGEWYILDLTIQQSGIALDLIVYMPVYYLYTSIGTSWYIMFFSAVVSET